MRKRDRGITAVPRLPVSSGEPDAFVRDLLDRCYDMALQARPTMGTVSAVQGGELVVHIDGERISRTVGFARKKGVRYQEGDRVKLSLLRNDEYVVDGLVGSDATDRSVDRAQIAVDAIGTAEIAVNVIDSGHLESNLRNRVLTSVNIGQVNTAINQALASYYTKSEANNEFAPRTMRVQPSGAIQTLTATIQQTINAFNQHFNDNSRHT